MSFLYPNILWFLLLVPALLVLVVLAWRSTGQGWRRLISAQHSELVVQRPLWRTALPASLALLALVCIIIALARPINGYREGGATASGRNLLIALDISRSMETEDVKPSRLAEARAAAYELIDALPGDKIGLIVFSGEADLVVPLTYDHTALRDALEQVNRTWAGVGGTNFGLVLRKAMQDFKRSTPDGSTNALVILSDGEDTVNSSIEIAEEARESKLLVITVGIGTAAGGPIPDAKGENGLYQDANGKHVISKLNTESLSQFAKATGGDFFVMNSNADLTAFTQAAVDKIDKHEEAFSLNKVPNDLFTPFASTALILLAFAALSSTEWKRYKHFILIAALGGMTPGIQAAPSAESAALYRSGMELISKGEADKAKEAFSTALLDEDTALQAASLYQIGQINAAATFNELRALYGAGGDEGIDTAESPKATPESLQKIVDSLKQDIQPYRDALKLQPALTRAQKNITGIEQLIKKLEEEIERLKQQQQQQQQQQNEQNQDKQDQKQQQDEQNKQDEQQKDEQQQNEQDKQDEQQKESQSQQSDQDSEEQKNNSQDKQDSAQDMEQEQQNKEQQQEQNQQQEQPGQSPEKEHQDTQPAQPQEEQPSDEEKARRYAASVLRSHLDEEQGSPIPHTDLQIRQPDKDY